MIIRIPTSILAEVAAASLLVGCSGGVILPARELPQTSQSVVGQRHFTLQASLIVPLGFAHLTRSESVPSFPRGGNPNDSTVYVMECGFYGSDCNVYSGGSVLYTLTSSDGMSNPQGTFVAPISGDWYIANTAAKNVPIYDLTSGGPRLETTINESDYPVQVAVTEKGSSLSVAISNILDATLTHGSVIVCKNKPLHCANPLTDPNAGGGESVAWDSAGNCYWSYNMVNGTGPGQIDEFKNCKGEPQNLGISLEFAGGLATDGQGNLWYTDQLTGSVYACSGVKNCSLAFSGFSDPLSINFSADFTTLYVADQGVSAIDACTIGGSCSTYAIRSASDPPSGVAPDPGAI